MKKLVALLLAAVICVVCFAGCGQPAESETPASQAPAEDSATPGGESSQSAADLDVEQPVTAANLKEASQAGYQYALDNGKTYKIGVSWYALSTEFMAVCKYYMDQYVEENYGDVIELIHLDANSDAANQLDQVSNLISQNVDVILLNPFDKEQVAPAVDECYEAGIPVVEFNSVTTADAEKRVTYVGSDHVYSGELLAEALIEKVGEEAKWVVLEGPTGHDGQVGRTEGMENVLAEHPGIEIVANKTCNWVREEAMSAVENWIQAGLEFDAVFAQNDEMGLGAQAALEGTAYEDTVIIGSVDGISDAVNAVKEGGNYYCTVFQNAAGQGEGAIDAALGCLAGLDFEDFIDIPYELVTAENVDDPAYDTSEVTLN